MLIAENVRKSYDNRIILKGIDLVVNDGEFVSIMGESGSGKSTLLSILSGNQRPDSGKVTFDGFDITDAKEKELAKYWGVTRNTLQKWRASGIGPLFLRLGGKVSYPREYIEAFEKKNIYKAISEKAETSEA